MKKKNLIIAAVVVVICAALLAACGNSDDSKSQKKAFEVATPNGQISLSSDGKLPPNWPSSFPLPQGAQPLGSGSLGGSEKTGMIAAFSTTSTSTDTFNYYINTPSITYTDKRTVGTGSKFVGSIHMTTPYDATVTVATHDEGSVIMVQLLNANATSTSSSTSTSTSTSTSR